MGEFKVELENLTDKEKKTFLELVKKCKKHCRKCMNEIYYSIRPNGNIVSSVEENTFYDDNCWKFGNYYNTIKEAEFAKQKKLVMKELRDYAFKHNNEEINWDNSYQLKHFLKYDWDKKKVYCGWETNVQSMNQVYFSSAEIAKNAIKEIGEDRIKKYLFEVD